MYTSRSRSSSPSAETAEALRWAKDAGDRAKLTEVMKTVSNILATEAQRSYNFFRPRTRTGSSRRCTHGGAANPCTGRRCGGKIGVEVELFNPFEG
jgi:hypothetical protein